MSSRQKHPAHLSKSKNRPRFVNPVPLPAVAEFRLDNILTKVLPQETASVSLALLEVCDNYQQDLKGEIRKALAIEQKIQNKNIHAIKQTHKLTKQLHNKRKQLMRLTSGKGETGKPKNLLKRRNPGLAAEVDEVLAQSISISTNVKALALKMADISAKQGGLGIPDMQKYPRLNKLLTSLSPETGENGKYDIEEGENQLPISTPVCAQEHKEITIDDDDDDDHPLNNGRPMQNEEDHVSIDLEPSHPLDNDRNDENSVQNTLLPIWETDPLAGSRVEQETQSPKGSENEDEAMDLCAFEMFMDSSIAKYRERQEQRSRTLASSFLDAGSGTGAGSRPARNPLRLLSSGAIGLGNQHIKLSPFLEQSDPFKYLFLPRKSAATVLETNQLSLHKKLRIRVLPSAHKTPADLNCGCRGENKPKIPPSDIQENNDICSSSKVISGAGPATDPATDLETETETDSVLGISSLSDANSSSESLGSNIGETNRYYLSLQSNLRLKRKSRRHRRSRKLGARNLEVSPTLKHEPLHRVLQPKQSILKLTKGKEGSNISKANVELEPQLPDRLQVEELKYMSSPRASLTNECAVPGMIVQGATSEDLEVGDEEFALGEEPDSSSQIENNGVSGEIVDGSSHANRVGPSQALDKLKSLVL